MSSRASSKRPSRRRSVEAIGGGGNDKAALNLNGYAESGASRGRARTQVRPASGTSVIAPINQPVAQQTTVANVLIDVEAIEDDVQLLSPSGFFLQGRNGSGGNHPVTVVLDEDSDVQAHSSGVHLNEPAARLAANNRNQQKQRKRTIINCEENENVEVGHKSKRSNAGGSVETRSTAPKSPAFTCAICWGALVEETSTVCGHIFCQGCIKAAIQAQKKCPTCRRALTMKNIHRVYLPTTN